MSPMRQPLPYMQRNALKRSEEAPIGYPRKIATCCYCGTRAALVLKGEGRHELACSACGAPLHDLKMLRMDKSGDRDLVRPSRTRVRAENPVRGGKWDDGPRHSKPRKRKRRKTMMKKLFEEAFDLIEDIFD